MTDHLAEAQGYLQGAKVHITAYAARGQESSALLARLQIDAAHVHAILATNRWPLPATTT